MKKITRTYVIETASLFFITSYISGITFSDGLRGILITGVILTAAVFLIKPVVNLLILPLNLVTFGLFKWVSLAITLYILDLGLSGFAINSFNFAGTSFYGIIIPSINLLGFPALIAFSFLLSLVSSIGFWLID